MFARYGAVLRAPGAGAFCATGLVMRLPIAIYPVALVLLVSLRTHEYGFGGYLAAAYVIGSGVGNPLLSRWADRRGQRATLVPASVAHAAAVGVLLVLVGTGAPRGTWLAPAAVAGLAYVSVGALVRARWVHLLGGTPELATAFSVESTLDEVIFVTGPILAGVLATTVDPAAPLVLAPLLVLAGAVGLTRLHGTEPPVRPHGAEGRPRLPTAPMTLLVGTLIAVGMTFGAVELAAIAFVGQAGQTRWTGAVVACFALGSASAGLWYGARHRPRDVLRRFGTQVVVFALLPALLSAALGVPTLAGLLFVVGLGTAPLLIAAFGVVEQVAPAARLTEAMAWTTTGLGVGYGVTAPVVGALADAHGARVALLTPVGTGLLVLGLGLVAVAAVRRERVRRAGDVPPAWDDGRRAALP